jgi:nucleoid-associated protein YgaU
VARLRAMFKWQALAVLALAAGVAGCTRVPPRGTAAPAAPAPRSANAPLPALPRLAPSAPAAGGETRTSPAPASAPASAPMLHAHAAVDDAENRIGLSDEELSRLEQAKRRLLAGDAAPLLLLDAQFAAATRSYAVQQPETLAQVAARPEVYGNAGLWPLILRANPAQSKPPALVAAGVRLDFPAHPTARDAAAAIDYAHSAGGTPDPPRAAVWP